MRPASGFWEDIEKKMHNYYWPKPYLPLSSHIIRFCHFELSDCYTLEMFGTFRIFRFEKTQKKTFTFSSKRRGMKQHLIKPELRNPRKKTLIFHFRCFIRVFFYMATLEDYVRFFVDFSTLFMYYVQLWFLVSIKFFVRLVFGVLFYQINRDKCSNANKSEPI